MDIKWWIGKVAVLDDPEQRGRIKVRINGIHHDKGVLNGNDSIDRNTGIGLKDDDLPWAICLMPFTYSGTVPPPQIPINSWVLGISLDGDAYQELICLGRLTVRQEDMNEESRCKGGILGGGQESTITTTLLNTILQAFNGNSGSSSSSSSSVNNNNPNSSNPVLGNGGSKTYDTSQPVINNYYNALNNANCNEKAINNLASAIEALRNTDQERYARFTESSGITIDANTPIKTAFENDCIKTPILKSWYNYNLKRTNDPVLAALSYSEGYGKVVTGFKNEVGSSVSPIINELGTIQEPTYSCLVDNLSKLSDPTYKDVANGFIQSFGEKNLIAVKTQCGSDITSMNNFILDSDSLSSISLKPSDELNSSTLINNFNTTNENDILWNSTNSTIESSNDESFFKKGNVKCMENGARWYSSNDYIHKLGFSEIVFPCDTNQLRTPFINTGEYLHLGIDIGANENDLLFAVADGQISKTFPTANSILLKCSNGISFRYSHCKSTILDSTPNVTLNVSCGDIIGRVGNYFTVREIEPHLHLDIFSEKNITSRNFEFNSRKNQDPEEFFIKSGIILS